MQTSNPQEAEGEGHFLLHKSKNSGGLQGNCCPLNGMGQEEEEKEQETHQRLWVDCRVCPADLQS